MLQILHADQMRSESGDRVQQLQSQNICPSLSYRAYNEAIKEVFAHFGLPNARFTTHGARIGAATTQFAETR